MAEPTIEDLEYDLIVLNTGLIETMIASAAAASGHQVLVLDANPYYGGAWANLTLQQLYDTLCTVARAAQPQSAPPPALTHVHLSGPLDPDLQAASGSFTLDLAPKALFCQGPFMQQLLAAGVHHYLEFKLLGASRLWSDGALVPVPASRADVFQSRHLSLEAKRQLMRFLKAATASEGDPHLQTETLSQCLQRHGLTDPALQRVVTLALARAATLPTATTADMPASMGMAAISRYMASIGVYGPASSPFLGAMYGSGEYAQAFSRLAAVKGGTFVLRRAAMSVVAAPDGGYAVDVDGQRLRGARVLGAASQLEPRHGGDTAPGVTTAYRAVVLVDGHLAALGAVEVGCTLVVPLEDQPAPTVVWGMVHGAGLGTCPPPWCERLPSEGVQRCILTCCHRQVLHLTCAAGADGPHSGPREVLEPVVTLLTSQTSGDDQHGRVRWAAYFAQAGGAAQVPQERAKNSSSMGVAPPPDAALHLDGAAEEAARLYAALFDGAAMFDGVWVWWCTVLGVTSVHTGMVAPGDDDGSDEELVGAVQAALSLAADAA